VDEDRPLPYVPLEAKGWRFAMGLRPLDLARWLEVDARRDEELALKAALLEECSDVVVATDPAGREASVELLDAVGENLALYHDVTAPAPVLGDHPVVAAARLVQEDLCVLLREDAWRLRAACVCFPSRWDLASKLGATLDEIHSPVPGYDAALAAPTNAAFDRLSPERSFWRLNWTLVDSPVLHQPRAARGAPSGDLAEWYFRVERQTLRRLARTGAVVFTIRTYVASAAALAASDDAFVASLLRSLDTAPADLSVYKGWTGVAERLRAALRASG
jgi:hypothetical protein